MSNVTKIHSGKSPTRIHFIVEWAEKRGLRQTDIVEEVGADKGLVSRWFKGTIPKEDYLEKLAALFGTDVHGLFRHPDDDWMARFFQNRSREELERMKTMLEAAFPVDRKDGTAG